MLVAIDPIGTDETQSAISEPSACWEYINFQSGKYHYVTSFELLKYNDVEIVLIKEYPCKTKDQLLARKRFYIESLECVNKNIPGRTSRST